MIRGVCYKGFESKGLKVKFDTHKGFESKRECQGLKVMGLKAG
jgi:hypothetical protein